MVVSAALGVTLRQSVKRYTFNVKFITPLLIGGGEKDQRGNIVIDKDGLSGKALRGCWRFWCRAVIGGLIPNIDRNDLYKLESKIFGSAKSDVGAKFRLIIEQNDEIPITDRINLGFKDRYEKFWVHSKGFIEGTSYSITIIPRDTMPDNLRNILFCTIWLWGNLGSVGKRERRGFGSPILYNEYLSKWGELSEGDKLRLKEILSENFGIDWVKTANIENTDDSKIIKISTETDSLALRLINEKNRAHLEIDGVRTNCLIAKTEEDKLNIYYDPFSFQNKGETDITLPLEEEFDSVNTLENYLCIGLQNVWSTYKQWISTIIADEDDSSNWSLVKGDLSTLSAPTGALFFILQSCGQIAVGDLGFADRNLAIKSVHGISRCNGLGWARRNDRMSSPVYIRFHKLKANGIVEYLPIFTWCKQSGVQDRNGCAQKYLTDIKSNRTSVFTTYLNGDDL